MDDPKGPAVLWTACPNCGTPEAPCARLRRTDGASCCDECPHRDLGFRVSSTRRRLGLSQVALAALIGRSESWVSQVERGKRGVDRLSVLRRLGAVLGVDLISRDDDGTQLPNTNKDHQHRKDET